MKKRFQVDQASSVSAPLWHRIRIRYLVPIVPVRLSRLAHAGIPFSLHSDAPAAELPIINPLSSCLQTHIGASPRYHGSTQMDLL